MYVNTPTLRFGQNTENKAHTTLDPYSNRDLQPLVEQVLKLSGCSDVVLFKDSRPYQLGQDGNDSWIFKFKGLDGKCYALKSFADTWANSHAIYNNRKLMNKLIETGHVTKVVQSFTLPLLHKKSAEQRFVVYEFGKGQLLEKYLEKHPDKQKEIQTQLLDMAKKFAHLGVSLAPVKSDFLVSENGHLVLTDWDKISIYPKTTPVSTIHKATLWQLKAKGLIK